MDLIKVGDWMLNVEDIVGVHYVATLDGPTIEVYTRSGGESYRSKGGFTAVGDEARRLWAWFVAQSHDVMTTPTARNPAVDAARGAANGAEFR